MKILEWIKNKLSFNKEETVDCVIAVAIPKQKPIVHCYCESPELVPVKAHGTDSGYDLFAKEEMTIMPNQWTLVPTGVFIKIENKDKSHNIELQIRPKSGLASKKGLSILNTPGTVDQGYTGEICVIAINHGVYPYVIEKHTKIAQAVFAYVPIVDMKFVDKEEFNKLSETADRGADGFGSTGLKK